VIATLKQANVQKKIEILKAGSLGLEARSSKLKDKAGAWKG